MAAGKFEDKDLGRGTDLRTRNFNPRQMLMFLQELGELWLMTLASDSQDSCIRSFDCLRLMISVRISSYWYCIHHHYLVETRDYSWKLVGLISFDYLGHKEQLICWQDNLLWYHHQRK
jgi:hypothetical protein